MNMLDVLPIITIWPVFIGVGMLIVALLNQQKTMYAMKQSDTSVLPLRGGLLVGTWFLIGAGVVTLAQFLLSLLGIPLFISLYGSFAVAIVGFVVRRNEIRILISSLHLRSMFFMALIFFPLFFLFFSRSFSRTMYTWDASAFWIPKMFALWQDQRVTPKTFEFFNHPEYPLLLPIIGADAYSLSNTPNEIAVKVAIFGFTVALFLVFNGYIAESLHPVKRAAFLLFFFSLFVVREHVAGEYVGTADILVGIYIAAGSVLLLLRKPLLAMAVWAFVPWVKTEGIVWAMIALSTTTVLYRREIFQQIWKIFFIGICALSWFIYTKVIGLSSQYFKFDEIYARPWVEYAVYSVHAFREEFRNLQKWNLVFFFFLSAVFTSISKVWRDKRFFIILMSLVVQLLSYIVIFTITPEEQATFIAASVSRLTLHLAPTIFMLTIALLQPLHKDV